MNTISQREDLIEFSPYPILLLDDSNPVDDRLIAKNLQSILTGIWGNARIPISQIDKELFDRQEKDRKEKKPEKGKKQPRLQLS